MRAMASLPRIMFLSAKDKICEITNGTSCVENSYQNLKTSGDMVIYGSRLITLEILK